MQPYLFPYIGYWQLMNAVDQFVILDDVNYIVRGYINRNRILFHGQPYMFTIPIKKASQNRLIMDTELRFETEDKRKILLTIRNAYKKAPYFETVMPIIEDIILNPEKDLTSYIRFSMENIIRYLDADIEILQSSEIEKKQNLKAGEKIIEICKVLGADTYINPCGGRALYDHSDFEKEGIKLFFLDTKEECISYDQRQDKFVPNLSIIDILMFNDVRTIQKFLKEYELNY